jgi:hypothetical protein
MQLKKMMVVLAAASVMVLTVGCGGKNQMTLNQAVGTRTTQALFPPLILDGLDDSRLQNTIAFVGIGEGRGTNVDAVLVRRMANTDGDRQIAAFFEQHIGAIYEEYRAMTNNNPEVHVQDAIVTRINERIGGVLSLNRYTTEMTDANGMTRIFVIRYIAGRELLNAMNDAVNELQNNNPQKDIATRLRAGIAIGNVNSMMDSGRVLGALD